MQTKGTQRLLLLAYSYLRGTANGCRSVEKVKNEEWIDENQAQERLEVRRGKMRNVAQIDLK